MSLTCPHCHKPFTLVAAVSPGTASTTASVPAAAASTAAGHWFCPVHGRSRIVPAGVSQRTGQPYAAFWACPERDCKMRPPKGFPVPQGAPVAAVEAPEPPAPAPTELEELPF